MTTSSVLTGAVAVLVGAAGVNTWIAAGVALLVGYAAREAALWHVGE